MSRRIYIDLSDAENTALIRLRKRRGITNREKFIADLVRRELTQLEAPSVDRAATLKDDVYRRAVEAVEELPRVQRALSDAEKKLKSDGALVESVRSFFYTQRRLAAEFQELKHRCAVLAAQSAQSMTAAKAILEGVK